MAGSGACCGTRRRPAVTCALRVAPREWRALAAEAVDVAGQLVLLGRYRGTQNVCAGEAEVGGQARQGATARRYRGVRIALARTASAPLGCARILARGMGPFGSRRPVARAVWVLPWRVGAEAAALNRSRLCSGVRANAECAQNPVLACTLLQTPQANQPFSRPSTNTRQSEVAAILFGNQNPAGLGYESAARVCPWFKESAADPRVALAEGTNRTASGDSCKRWCVASALG